jgi:hypothetical protein
MDGGVRKKALVYPKTLHLREAGTEMRASMQENFVYRLLK